MERGVLLRNPSMEFPPWKDQEWGITGG
jgi:hypothetical protein